MKKSILVLLAVLLFCRPILAMGALLPGGDFQTQNDNDPYGWTQYGGASLVPKTWDASLTGVVPNGDFESVSGSTFTGWSFYRGQYASVSTDIKYGGNNALHFSGQTAHAYQDIKLKPDTDYIFSARVYMTNTTTAGTSITLTYYAADGGSSGTGDGIAPAAVFDQWQEVSSKIHTAPNVDYATIYIRYEQTGGDFYYDDVTLYEAPKPDFTFDTEEVFFYADEETGEATVYANNLQGNEKVNFSLSYLGNEIDAKQISFSGGKAVYSFPLSLLSQMKKEYVLSASVLRGSTEVKAFSEKIYKYPRPSALSKDGVYRIDGEPFYPVIGYHVYGDDYKRMEEIGVNVVQVSASVTEEQLDSFLEHNVMALVGLYSGVPLHMKPGGHPENQDAAIQAIERLKDHPAVFGWAAQDEPFWLGQLERMEEWVKDTYRLVRNRDDKHPVYICQAPAQYYPLAAKYCDILACDPYPYSDDSKKVTTQTEMSVRAAKSNKPVYSILQTYGATPPGIDYIRQQVYRSFESGAKGIGYYSISDSATSNNTPIYNYPDPWNGLSVFAEKELPYLFEIFTNPSGTAWDSGNETDVYSQYYRAALSANGETVYAALHNRSNSETTVTVPIPARFTVQRIGETGSAAGNTSYTVTLGAQKAALYKFTLLSAFSAGQLPQITKPVLTPFVYPTTYNEVSENLYVSLPVDGASVSTRVYNLKPQTSYKLELSYKASKKNALRLQITYHVQDENGFSRVKDYYKANHIEYIEKELAYADRFGTAQEGGGQWRKAEFDFYTPKNCNAIYVELDAYVTDFYAAVDNVYLSEQPSLNLIKNGSLDFLNNENTLAGGWFSYNEYMTAYGNVSLQDGYIELREYAENGTAILRQSVYLYEGETYTLTFRHKGTKPDVSVFQSAASVNRINGWNGNFANWRTYSLVFTAKQTGVYALQFNNNDSTGTNCYDDIRLFPLETKEALLCRSTGESKDADSVEYVCIPISEVNEGNYVVIMPNVPGTTLYAGVYGAGSELLEFAISKTDHPYLKVSLPYSSKDTDVKVFKWKAGLQTIGKQSWRIN